MEENPQRLAREAGLGCTCAPACRFESRSRLKCKSKTDGEYVGTETPQRKKTERERLATKAFGVSPDFFDHISDSWKSIYEVDGQS